MYANYLSVEGEQAVKGAFGANYPRLRSIKSKYDPNNFFRLNPNIRPAATLESSAIVRKFNDLSSHILDFYQIATIYAGLGEKDEAFGMLGKDYEQRSASMPYLTVDPF